MLRSSLLRHTRLEPKCLNLGISCRGYAQVFGSPLDDSQGILSPPTTPPTTETPEQSAFFGRARYYKDAPVRRVNAVNGVVNGRRAAVRLPGGPRRFQRPSLLARLREPVSALPLSIDRETGGLLFEGKHFQPILLRDSCTCPRCVDLSSTQKNFQTTDIPSRIRIKSLETLGDGGEIRIKWKNDIPGFAEDHVTVFTEEALQFSGINSAVRDRTRPSGAMLWDTAKIRKVLEFVDYDDYMKSNKKLWRALWLLQTQGLMIIRNVPESEKSVEDIALRIGNIRDSLYGRTWDVKSVPDAKNVAYTAKHLGLHMDLLYMANPPGFQFLHCLKSTAKGGASLFADAFQAAKSLSEPQRAFLAHTPVAYQYKNAGEHYYHTHHVIELEEMDRARGRAALPPKIININYSPPFQANYLMPHSKSNTETEGFLNALRAFTEQTERDKNLLEYRLQEGECVIFNNRRILHGRKQFDALGGERWLKGTYVDTDVVNSRYRVLEKQFDPEINWTGDPGAQYVFEEEIARDRGDSSGPEAAAATGQ